MKKILFLILILLIIIFTLIQTGKTAVIFTEYTENFSYEKLASLKKGFSTKNVRKILGEPFTKADSGLNCDSYSKPKYFFGLTDFLGWKSIRVCYDNNGKFSEVGENVFFN